MCELLRITLINGGKFTGAATGLDLPPIGKVFGVDMDKLANAYVLVAVFMLLACSRLIVIANSRYGRTLALDPRKRATGPLDRRQHQHA